MRARAMWGRLLTMALGAIAWIVVVSGEVEGQTLRPELVSLQFEGNRSFSDRALANAIVTRPTDCRSLALQPFCWAGAGFALDPSFLTSRVLRDDYARVLLYYYQRGYREAQVDTVVTRRDDGRAEVLFRIEEGEPVRIAALEVTGLEEIGAPEVGEGLPVGEGDPLNLINLDATRDTVTRRLRNEGYAHAEVLRHLFIPSDEPYRAEVEFEAYPGPRSRFGPVEVVGNEKVDDTVVRRMLSFQEGDLYSEELIHTGQRNLFNLDIFRHASISQDRDHQPDTIVPIQVQVNEGHAHRVRTGVGWTTAECLNTDNRWTSRNFLGGARRLVLRGRVANLLTSEFRDPLCPQAGTGEYGDVNWSLSADFTQPWIFSPRNNLTLSVFGERQSLQDIFVRQAFGVNLGLSRSLGRETSASLSFRPQVASLDAAEVFFCTSFLICDPRDIDALQASNRLFPVGVSWARDRTNHAVSPTAGYSLMFDLEHASRRTGSDFSYDRLITEGTWFHEIWHEVIFATRLRAALMEPRSFEGNGEGIQGVRIAHPQKRFFSGGANSVRGFAQNQLGPRVLTVGTDQLLQRPAADGEPLCRPEEIVDRSCDASAIPDAGFLSRPTGGNAVVEGSVELRFPITASLVHGAAFLDFGQVWRDSGDFAFGDLEAAPGAGLRVMTPIGPLRMDLGYRVGPSQRLQVITSDLEPFDPDRHDPAMRIRGPDDEPLGFVLAEELALLEPRVLFDERSAFDLGRLQLHLSIGHAF